MVELLGTLVSAVTVGLLTALALLLISAVTLVVLAFMAASTSRGPGEEPAPERSVRNPEQTRRELALDKRFQWD